MRNLEKINQDIAYPGERDAMLIKLREIYFLLEGMIEFQNEKGVSDRQCEAIIDNLVELETQVMSIASMIDAQSYQGVFEKFVVWNNDCPEQQKKTSHLTRYETLISSAFSDIERIMRDSYTVMPR